MYLWQYRLIVHIGIFSQEIQWNFDLYTGWKKKDLVFFESKRYIFSLLYGLKKLAHSPIIFFRKHKINKDTIRIKKNKIVFLSYLLWKNACDKFALIIDIFKNREFMSHFRNRQNIKNRLYLWISYRYR